MLTDKLNNIDKGKASPLLNCLKSIAGKPSIQALFLFLSFLITDRTDSGKQYTASMLFLGWLMFTSSRFGKLPLSVVKLMQNSHLKH